MHRLRARKKGKTDDDVPPVPNLSSAMPFLKRNKASPAPEKPDLGAALESALPPSDDFRTSLLMPNLANRFSILKEQEAAAAAASQARGAAIGGLEAGSESTYSVARHSNLGDIAEGDVNSAQDPSQAQSPNRYTTRSNEESGRPSEDGSVMSRGRGGDGNVLFGGRQKVYKVTNKALRGVGSLEDLRSESPIGTGRALYQPDIPDVPPPPRNRPKYLDEEPLNINTDTGDNVDYNKNRYTSSSTNSTPASVSGPRMSTAATSINSQQNGSISTKSVPQSPTSGPIKRGPLYEQALDRQLQEQQSNAMGRLERLASLTRMRTTSPEPFGRSESPLGGNYNRLHDLHLEGMAPSSPHSTSALPLTTTVAPLSPASPRRTKRQDSETNVLPQSPLEAFDFGLPTRPPPEIPVAPVNPPESPVRESRASSVSRSSSEQQVIAPLSPKREAPQTSAPRVEEENTGISARSTLTMSSTGDPSFAEQNLMMKQIAEDLDTGARKASVSHGTLSPRSEKAPTAANSARSSASSRSVTVEIPSDASIQEHLKNPQLSTLSPQFQMNTHRPEDDSPTLPPGGGLSLMIRQHLRSDSGSSSVYADSVFTKKSRMSRIKSHYDDMVPPMPTSDAVQGKEKRASGSSQGNMWQYEEFDASPHANEGKEEDGGSPTSIYPPTIHDAPPSPPPPVPPVPKIPVAAEEAGQDARSGRRVEAGRDQPGSRSNSRAAMDRAPLPTDDSDRDWEEQLAYRRQLIQQNLRNQEKIQSQAHDMQWENGSGARSPVIRSPVSGAGPFGALRSKTSNGFLKGDPKNAKNEHPPMPRPDPRMIRPGLASPRPSEEQARPWPGPRGPPPRNGPFSPQLGPRPGPGNFHPGPPGPGQHPGPHPLQLQNAPRGPPPQRPRRPSVNTDHAGESDPLHPGVPRPQKSPLPRLLKQGSREQMSGLQSGENTPRGQPMGWSDNPSRTPNTQPTTPITPGPGTPAGARAIRPETLHDDLTRAMMTGQSQSDTERFAPKKRPGMPSPMPSSDDVKSTFESSSNRRTNFMRPRGNSILSPTPSSSDLSKMDRSPVPGTPASSSFDNDRSTPPVPPRGTSPPKVSDAEVVRSIESSNAAFQPARKRAVSKHLISEPTLISSTSSVPTIDLPPMPAMPPMSAKAAAPRARRKTATNGRERYGFGRRPSEDITDLTPMGIRSDDEDVGTKKPNKLRKSTSDGGGLSARVRTADIQAMNGTMPKVNTNMVGPPMAFQQETVVVGAGEARMI